MGRYSNSSSGGRYGTSSSSGGGKAPKKPSGITGFFSNLVDDVQETATGLIPGMVAMGSALAHDAKKAVGLSSGQFRTDDLLNAIRKSYTDEGTFWGELGRISLANPSQIDDRLRNAGSAFYSNPLGPLLDGAALLTGGGALVGKAGQLSGKAQGVSRVRATDAAGFDRKLSRNPVIATRQRGFDALSNRYTAAPLIGAQARTAKNLRRTEAHKLARENAQVLGPMRKALAGLDKWERKAVTIAAGGHRLDDMLAMMQNRRSSVASEIQRKKETGDRGGNTLAVKGDRAKRAATDEEIAYEGEGVEALLDADRRDSLKVNQRNLARIEKRIAELERIKDRGILDNPKPKIAEAVKAARELTAKTTQRMIDEGLDPDNALARMSLESKILQTAGVPLSGLYQGAVRSHVMMRPEKMDVSSGRGRQKWTPAQKDGSWQKNTGYNFWNARDDLNPAMYIHSARQMFEYRARLNRFETLLENAEKIPLDQAALAEANGYKVIKPTSEIRKQIDDVYRVLVDAEDVLQGTEGYAKLRGLIEDSLRVDGDAVEVRRPVPPTDNPFGWQDAYVGNQYGWDGTSLYRGLSGAELEGALARGVISSDRRYTKEYHAQAGSSYEGVGTSFSTDPAEALQFADGGYVVKVKSPDVSTGRLRTGAATEFRRSDLDAGPGAPLTAGHLRELRGEVEVEGEIPAVDIEGIYRHNPDGTWQEMEIRDGRLTEKEGVATTREPGKVQEVAVVPAKFYTELVGEFTRSSEFVRRFIDTPTRVWRALTLNMRPAWIVNNFVGQMFLLALSHGGRGMKAYFEQFGKKGKVADDLAPELVDFGWAHESMADLAGLGGNKVTRGMRRISDFMGDLNARLTDSHTRKAAWVAEMEPHIRRLRKSDPSLSYEDAAKRLWQDEKFADEITQRVLDDMIDFSDLSEVERRIVKRAIPFWSWIKGISKRTARLVADEPWKAAAGVALAEIGQDAVRDRYGDVPHFLQGIIDAPDALTGKDGVLTTQGMNPFMTPGDVVAMISGTVLPGRQDGPQNPLAQMNPLFKAPLEALSNRDFFYGRDLDPRGVKRSLVQRLLTDVQRDENGEVDLKPGGQALNSFAQWRLFKEYQQAQAAKETGLEYDPLYEPSLRDAVLQYLGIPVRQLDVTEARRRALEA